MEAPQRAAQRLIQLSRSRSILTRSGTDPGTANRRLAGLLADYERTKLEALPHLEAPSREAILAAVNMLLDIADADGPPDEDSLQAVHGLLNPQSRSRRIGPGPVLCPNHRPLSASQAPRALERFFDWVGSPGFRELHAVEQMTLCQVRLLEISPFEDYSPTASFIIAVYFPLRSRYLLPYFQSSELGRFWDCLSRAFAFSTAELVEYNLDACQAAFDELDRTPLS